MKMKYTLLKDETINVSGRTLYRIVCVTPFGCIKAGDKGGYVESTKNLSQEGKCWIYDDAQVYDDAIVFDDAEVYNKARISGNAKVYGDAVVYGNAVVSDDAKVFDNARVFGKAKVYGNAVVFGDARVCDTAEVGGYAFVFGNAEVCGTARIFGTASIYATADYYVGKNVWSSGRYFTYTRSNKMWKVGCFYGTGEELIEKAYQDSEVSGREYARTVRYVEAMYADLEKDKE